MKRMLSARYFEGATVSVGMHFCDFSVEELPVWRVRGYLC